MTNRFIDGFDHYNSLSLMNLKWTTTSGTAGYVTGTSTRFNKGGAFAFNANAGSIVKVLDNQATWIVGFAINFSSFSSVGIFLSIQDAGTTQVDLRMSSTGALSITRNGTVLATTATGAIALSVWHYLELKVTINNTTGSYEIRMDGNSSPLLSASGVNTRNTANNFADRIAFSWSGANAQYTLDDLYLNDGTGSSPDNDFWGDVRIDTQYPGGAGNYTQYTPSTGSNWQNVDETPPNGDTDYNSDSTVGHIDSFTMLSVTPLTGTVYTRQTCLYARKDDAGTRQIAPFFRHSTTDNAGTTVTLASSYAYFFQLYATNPATSAAWTISDCNNDEAGYKTIA